MLRVLHAFKYVEVAIATLRAQEAQEDMNNGTSSTSTTVVMDTSGRATNLEENAGIPSVGFLNKSIYHYSRKLLSSTEVANKKHLGG
jgi:hypothetical protein